VLFCCSWFASHSYTEAIAMRLAGWTVEV
jgi:hypothetical protein